VALHVVAPHILPINQRNSREWNFYILGTDSNEPSTPIRLLVDGFCSSVLLTGFVCDIWHSNINDYKHYCLLGCDTMQSGRLTCHTTKQHISDNREKSQCKSCTGNTKNHKENLPHSTTNTTVLPAPIRVTLYTTNTQNHTGCFPQITNNTRHTDKHGTHATHSWV